MSKYRQVFAMPGVAPLLGVSLLARVAITAEVMALTLYVVLGLDLSYAAAGGVAAAMTAGMALGGPVLGRMIDRRGPRVVLLGTSAAQAGFWLSAPTMPYGVLLGAALASGLSIVPAQLVTRQAIAAMTTADQRRAAFALESVQGELSYVVGPPIVILCAVHVSPASAAWVVGAAIVAGGVGIAMLDPPLRAEDEPDADPAERPRRREWLGADLTAVLVMALGVTTLLGGTDLAIVAALRAAGETSWATLVVAIYGLASIAGGLAYGALARPLPTWLLLAVLGLATLPAGLAGDWQWLCVAGVGAGLLAAPTLSAIAEAVSRLAPSSVRGEATGLQSSALSAGFALGSPLVGAAIDRAGPAAGFVAAGLAGLVTAVMGYLLLCRPRRIGPASGPSTDRKSEDARREPHLEGGCRHGA